MTKDTNHNKCKICKLYHAGIQIRSNGKISNCQCYCHKFPNLEPIDTEFTGRYD